MKLRDFVNLVRKHIILILITPVLLAGIVVFLTRNPIFKYASETTLYTGIASGSSIEMDKTFNYQASSTAFDNLISVIQSRKTQQEVAIRLLAKHLILSTYDPRYLSNKSFEELKRITPGYIRSLVVTSDSQPRISEIHTLPVKKNTTIKKESPVIEFRKHIVKSDETLFSISNQYNISVAKIKILNRLQSNKIKTGQVLSLDQDMVEESDTTGKGTVTSSNQVDSTISLSLAQLDSISLNSKNHPETINQNAYEKTVSNLTQYMLSNDTNFVYKLLNYVHPHYSIDAISSIKTQRIAYSDLVQLKYETDDPGICQQTLVILTEVCIQNYKNIKKNRSGDVVKYFEYQLKQASNQLKIAEDRLLKFNTDNNIINFNEQSKTVALKKEDLDATYNNNRIKLAGVQAAIQRLEEKLGNQHQIQLNNSNIIDKRNQLAMLNYKIISAETLGLGNATGPKKLADLKAQADKLKEEITQAVNQMYSTNNSTEGLPINKLLNDWINNIIEAENIKAGMKVLSLRMKEFQKQYDVYVPAGSNIKKIEREISVSEQQYLEILRNLNLAKLKMQDNEMASDIKIADPPYYPLSPIPTKRKILILVAAFLGFMMALSATIIMEFFNSTLNNPTKAGNTLKLPLLGVFPKILHNTRKTDFSYISDRLLNIAIQNIELNLIEHPSESSTKTILIFSTLDQEGKSVVMGSLANKLKKLGKKILVLNFLQDSIPMHGSTGYLSSASSSNIRNIIGFSGSQIDYESPYLAKLNHLLNKTELFYYAANNEFLNAKKFRDIMNENETGILNFPDYVFIELPSILYNSYPVGLLSNADLSILVCRANRSWSVADQGALDRISKFSNQKMLFVLNGVEMPAIETVLGESS